MYFHTKQVKIVFFRVSSSRKRKAGELKKESIEFIKRKQKDNTESTSARKRVTRSKEKKIKLEENKFVVEKRKDCIE